MATTATIIHKDANADRYAAIYLHWDGNPEEALVTLTKHYNSNEKAADLVALGFLSELHERLAPAEGEAHDYDNKAKGVTVAYHRDRSELWEDNRPEVIEDATRDEAIALLAASFESNYTYLFTTEGGWEEV